MFRQTAHLTQRFHAASTSHLVHALHAGRRSLLPSGSMSNLRRQRPRIPRQRTGNLLHCPPTPRWQASSPHTIPASYMRMPPVYRQQAQPLVWRRPLPRGPHSTIPYTVQTWTQSFSRLSARQYNTRVSSALMTFCLRLAQRIAQVEAR
jgi:hypothetical protein